MKQCLEERSIGRSQFCTMRTCWNAAFWNPGKVCRPYSADPGIPPPSDHPHGKLLHIFNHFYFFMHGRIPCWACVFLMRSRRCQIQLQQCVTIGTVEPSVKKYSYFPSFEQIDSMFLLNDISFFAVLLFLLLTLRPCTHMAS